MSIEQIRTQAPKGATHYIDHHGVKYYKLDSDGFVYIFTKESDTHYECIHLHISETVLKPLN